jgi:hypothetical protein
MKNPARSLKLLLLGIGVCLGLSSGRVSGSATPLLHQPEFVLSNVLRAAQQKIQTTNVYLSHRVLLREELGDDGKVQKKDEQLFLVRVENGKTRYVPLTNQTTTASSNSNDDQRQQQFRSRDSRAITDELINRYAFTFLREEPAAKNHLLVFSFAPKSSDLPVKKMEDRLLNHLSGRVWIDSGDFQVARLEVGLPKKVGVWGGLLGSMHQFQFNLKRQQLEPGLWISESLQAKISGRKLFTSLNLRISETVAPATNLNARAVHLVTP